MAKNARRQRRLPFRIVAFVFAIVFLLASARESIAGYVCLKDADHGAAVGGGSHGAHTGHHPGSGHTGGHSSGEAGQPEAAGGIAGSVQAGDTGSPSEPPHAHPKAPDCHGERTGSARSEHCTIADHGDGTHAQAEPAGGEELASASDAQADATEPSQHAGHEGEPCSCLGDCQPGQTIASEYDTPDAYVVYTFPAPARVSHVAAWLPGTPKFLLPPANGPPLIG